MEDLFCTGMPVKYCENVTSRYKAWDTGRVQGPGSTAGMLKVPLIDHDQHTVVESSRAQLRIPFLDLLDAATRAEVMHGNAEACNRAMRLVQRLASETMA